MPNWRYSTLTTGDEMAKASGREIRISPKAAREVCRSLKGMKLDNAKIFLQNVIEKKTPVIYKRYNKKIPHRSGITGWYSGRYPIKAAKEILKILYNVEANAESKDLNIEELKIVHAASHRGRTLKRFTPRAYGRASPRYEVLCHIEVVVAEV